MAYKGTSPTPTQDGGTGLSSYTTGDTLYSSATNTLSKLAISPILGAQYNSNATNVVWRTPSNILSLEDDFFSDNTGFNLNWKITGSGGVFANNESKSTITGAHPGVVQLSTEGSSSGTAILYLGNTNARMIGLGFGPVSVTWEMALPVLSTVSETYLGRFGLLDAFTTDPAPNGVYWRYTDGNNSGKWQIVTVSASSATITNTNTTVDTSFHRYRMEVNAANTSIRFFIDDVEVTGSPVTTNLPSALICPLASMVKSNGSTARVLVADYFTLNVLFTTPR